MLLCYGFEIWWGVKKTFSKIHFKITGLALNQLRPQVRTAVLARIRGPWRGVRGSWQGCRPASARLRGTLQSERLAPCLGHNLIEDHSKWCSAGEDPLQGDSEDRQCTP